MINALRDQLLQAFAYILTNVRTSPCPADVLRYAGRILARASHQLGYTIPEPEAGRDAEFYKGWIFREAGPLNQATDAYRVKDGGMTTALPFANTVSRLIRDCKLQDSDLALDEGQA